MSAEMGRWREYVCALPEPARSAVIKYSNENYTTVRCYIPAVGKQGQSFWNRVKVEISGVMINAGLRQAEVDAWWARMSPGSVMISHIDGCVK